MAEFCKDCAKDMFGDDPKYNDFADRCDEDKVIADICEGCGPGYFDSEGKRWDPGEEG